RAAIAFSSSASVTSASTPRTRGRARRSSTGRSRCATPGRRSSSEQRGRASALARCVSRRLRSRAWHRAPGRHQPGSGARVGWATCTSALPFDEEAVLAQPLRLGGGREDDAELLAPARLAKFVEALLASRSLGKLVEAGDER